MSDSIRQDLCPLPDRLTDARFDLMLDAALFGPSARSKVEPDGMLWQNSGGWLQVVLLAGDRAAGVLALLGGGLAHLRSRRRL
ncbi:hypothetical protein HMPREF3159_14665 [Brachybacterium sp. HMSC06H03]|uniref:hypothetical protein n=1 Tax=Brachybacterium sp. HMSC06H03 TaxID=1581127 RepID=UPI0008A40894|nr:hypothetical protein [Brachybacterium sp. HMSC06H03]OFT46144.1 hypothetical protein HMPREF3159_14665 [Brachybacterium sp. HMSC06H03]